MLHVHLRHNDNTWNWRMRSLCVPTKIISAPLIIRINITIVPLVSKFVVSDHIMKMRVAIKK